MIKLCRFKARCPAPDSSERNWRTIRPVEIPFGNLSFDSPQHLTDNEGPPEITVRNLPIPDAEIITYVQAGVLEYKDALGSSGIIQAGEFQRMTLGANLHHRGPAISRDSPANVFQIWLDGTGTDLHPLHDKKHFSLAERRGRLCVVASPDARGGSLGVQLDMVVYSAILEPGQHIIHELANGRTAFVQLIQGELSLGGEIILSAGDGASISGELAVSLTARVQSEVLLVNLGGLLGLGPDEPN